MPSLPRAPRAPGQGSLLDSGGGKRGCYKLSKAKLFRSGGGESQNLGRQTARLFSVAGAPHWGRHNETRRDSSCCGALSQPLPSSPHPPHIFPELVPTAKIPGLEGRRALRMKRLPHPTLQEAHGVALGEGAGPGTTPTVGQVRTLRHGVPESIGAAHRKERL